MAARQKTSTPFEGAGFLGSEAVDSFNAAMAETAGRSREILEAGLAAWTQEAQRFYDELSVQGRTALEQLKACQSPVDVLSVEQAWLAARSKAYMDSGKRFAQAFAAAAQGQKPAETPPPRSRPEFGGWIAFAAEFDGPAPFWPARIGANPPRASYQTDGAVRTSPAGDDPDCGDEAIVRLELADRLADMGLIVLVANDADEAIGLLDSHPEIELLMTDIKMPVRWTAFASPTMSDTVGRR